MIARLKTLLAQIDTKVDSVLALCPDLVLLSKIEPAQAELTRIVGILADPNAAMNRHTVGHVAAATELALEALVVYECKYLVSAASACALRTRIVAVDGKCHEAYLRYQFSIETAFRKYDAARVEGRIMTEDLRILYDKAVSAVALAEGDVLPLSVKAVLRQPAPQSRQKRIDAERESRRAERQKIAPKKGSHSEIPNSGGTSKDALRRQRQRSRQARA